MLSLQVKIEAFLYWIARNSTPSPQTLLLFFFGTKKIHGQNPGIQECSQPNKNTLMLNMVQRSG